MRPIHTAILSVFDKRGLVSFAADLARRGVVLFASGGTHALLKKEQVPVCLIEEYTRFPEMMEGRVKTLHPLIHGGILARRDDPRHLAEAKEHGITLFDLVVVNLYPFRETVAKRLSPDDIIENIDIGGPALIRAAAKNHRDVVIVTSPDDYQLVIEELDRHAGATSYELRRDLARKAFLHTARYDAAIAEWFSRTEAAGVGQADPPPLLMLDFVKKETLRYGENPHQKAAIYLDSDAPSGTLARARQLGGKELSFNNYLDLAAVQNLVFEFEEPACAIMKHANPCGAAIGDSLADAYERALACDPVSAFGSVVGFNRRVDVATAHLVSKGFVEAILAPSFEEEAIEILRRKKNLRLLELGVPCRASDRDWELKKISGGLLLEEADHRVAGEDDLKVVTKRTPTPEERRMCLFGQRIVKHVKSNAVVLCTDREIVGVGAGQMSRVDALDIALRKARRPVEGLALASDAFFPFRDSIDLAASKGIRVIVQPGGSVRDGEVIAACDEHDIAMIFTGIRSFRHL